MQKISVQDYESYRIYMEDRLKSEPFGRGGKAKLAQHLNCQPSFVSQILKDKASLSLEQAHNINSFFEHNELEQDFFMSLVEHNNSGSVSLQNYFSQKLSDLRDKFKLVENRFNFDELSEEDCLTYYNNKNYVLVHHLVNIPSFQYHDELKSKLHLSENELSEILSFLLEKELIVETSPKTYSSGKKTIHLKKGSPISNYANTNVRLNNIKELQNKKKDDISYAAHFTCSKELYLKLKQNLIDTISEFSNELSEDNPEQLNLIVLDLKEI